MHTGEDSVSAIFISHSSNDNDIAQEVRALLETLGHRSVFLDFDPINGIPAGRSWEKELYAQLRSCQAVIVLCSEHSMASDWCFAEITHAKSLGKHIFPIMIQACKLRSVLTDTQVIDLTVDKEVGYDRLARGLLEAGLDPRKLSDWDGSRPLYPGLLAFQEADAAIYFGRDDDIQNGLDMLNRLQRFGGARLTLVLGASGSGKSSLVRAGLIPRLKRDADRWLVVDPFRPFSEPLKELSLVLADAFARYDTPRHFEDLHAMLTHAAMQPTPDGGALVEVAEALRLAARQREATVLLVIDQVEELLGYTPEDRARAFLPFLCGALQTPGSPLMAIGTLRSDFLGQFQAEPALRDVHFESIAVGPLSTDGFAQVIEGPANLSGLELESGLVQAMVEDTGANDALPLLAFTLGELYVHYGGDNLLTIDEYKDLGRLEGSVAHAAEAVMAAQKLSQTEQDDLRAAFISMVRINEEGQYTRRPAHWGDLPQRIHTVLDRFVAARLLISQSDDQGRVLEVAHEALFRAWHQLRRWLDEDRDGIRLRDGIQQAAQEWHTGGRETQLLVHRGARLEAAETLARTARFELNAVARDYVQACLELRAAEREEERRQQLAQKRRLQRTIVSLAAGLLIVAGLGLWALTLRNTAQAALEDKDVAEQAKITQAFQSGWRGLETLNPERSEEETLKECSTSVGGLRLVYCNLRRFLSLRVLSSLSGLDVFVSGPHKDFQLNFHSNAFGHYNKDFVYWLQQYAVPAANNES